jgi:hypothetical protein
MPRERLILPEALKIFLALARLQGLFRGVRIKMKLLTEKISRSELDAMAQLRFGNLVKGVVDVDRNLIVLDAELHADEESFLLESGSQQKDLWGINLYPEFPLEDDNFVEFDSMINLRPLDNNRSRSVEDPEIRSRILSIVREWVR